MNIHDVAYVKTHDVSILAYEITPHIKNDNEFEDVYKGHFFEWRTKRNIKPEIDMVGVKSSFTLIHIKELQRVKILVQTLFTIHNKKVEITWNALNDNTKPFVATLLKGASDNMIGLFMHRNSTTIFKDDVMPFWTIEDFIPNVEKYYAGELET